MASTEWQNTGVQWNPIFKTIWSKYRPASVILCAYIRVCVWYIDVFKMDLKLWLKMFNHNFIVVKLLFDKPINVSQVWISVDTDYTLKGYNEASEKKACCCSWDSSSSDTWHLVVFYILKSVACSCLPYLCQKQVQSLMHGQNCIRSNLCDGSIQWLIKATTEKLNNNKVLLYRMAILIIACERTWW